MTKAFTTAASRATGPVEFTIDGEMYQAHPVMSGDAMLTMAKQATGEGPVGDRIAAALSFLDVALLPESAERFAARFKDPANPISLGDATDVMRWLIEDVYVGRPTEPPSS